MLIRRIDAVFGKLQSQTLPLSDGLNILQLPPSSGEAVWCPFLLAMLYGPPPDASPRLPDSGRLECRAGEDSLVLLRASRQPSAPLAEFRALYAGTDEPVPALTASNCGEALFGVPRELFAHGAILRPAGPSGGRAAASERSITAPFTPGKNGSSYIEAVHALKQAQRLRSLTALEAKLQETESLRAIQGELSQKLERLRGQVASAEARAERLESDLSDLDRQEVRRQYQALQRAEEAAKLARQRADSLRRRMEEGDVPESDAVARLRGAIVNLETTRKAADKALAERDAAVQVLRQAEEAAAGSAFAGLSPEEAGQRSLDLPPKPRLPLWVLPLLALLGLGLGGALALSGRGLPLSAGCGCGLAGLLLLAASRFIRRRQIQWEEQTAQSRSRWQEALDAHIALSKALESAQSDCAAKTAAGDALTQTLLRNERGILQEIRRFAPAVSDLSSGDAALRASAVLRKGLAEADAAAEEAHRRWELLSQQTASLPPLTGEAAPAKTIPSRDREPLVKELEQARANAAALRGDAEQLSRRLQDAGGPDALQAAAEHLADQITRLKQEAPSLAADSAEWSASPLGRRAMDFLTLLTGGAGSEEDGTLYLAVRLAVCELALPAAAPLILDGALAGLEDGPCTAALRWLREASGARQILLFTRHSREAAFFSGDAGVSVQSLSDA